MAKDIASVIEDCKRFAQVTTSSGNTPASLFLGRLQRLDGIVAALRRGPRPDLVRIFGSAVNAPNLLPSDIDAFLDLTRVTEHERHLIKTHLLRVSTSGGYHGNYGFFDPFILERGRVKTRSEHDAFINARWVLSDIPTEIRAHGQAGVLLVDFTRNFVTQFGYHAERLASTS
jgi:hypothetical protein